MTLVPAAAGKNTRNATALNRRCKHELELNEDGESMINLDNLRSELTELREQIAEMGASL